ncbi:MAG: hypothetical protein AAGF23_21170, partial [Acidobacteriota bacterium]
EAAAPPEPAVPFAVQSVDLDIDVGDSSARLTHRIELALFSKEWQRIDLGRVGSFVDAALGDLEGRLDTAGGDVALKVRGRGHGDVGIYRIQLRSVLAVGSADESTRDLRGLELQVPRAAVVRGVLRTGEDVEEVELIGAGSRLRGGGGEWSFVALGGGALSFELRGRRRTPRRALLPLRFDATSATWAEVSRNRVRVSGRVEARVIQGRLETLELELPDGAEVATVDGAGWDARDGGLTLTPRVPAEDFFVATVELSLPPADEISSPLLRVRGGARSRHLTAVAAAGDGLLELVDGASLRAATPAELAALPSEVVHGRRFFAVEGPAPPRWRVEWARGTEVLAAQVDRLLVDVAVGEAGRAGYQVWAELRSRGVRHLALAPPEGFELIGAWRDGAPVTPGQSGASLAIPLTAHNRWVQITGTVPLEAVSKGRLELPLPTLSAPAARVEARAVLPPRRRYALADPSRAGEVGEPPRAEPSPVRPAPTNFIASQIGARRSVDPSFIPLLFERPPGYHEIGASWSALSRRPGALVIDVEPEKAGASWF